MYPQRVSFAYVSEAVDLVRSRAPGFFPAIGIVLGSGFGSFADDVASAITIPYTEIPHAPRSTVSGHSGRLVLATLAGVPVAILQGRVHLYEGYTTADVTFFTRLLGLLGCHTIIVTNAAGGINPELGPGSLVLMSDHINLTGVNAASGPNEPSFATRPGTAERFFDMSAAYSPRLRALVRETAQKQGFSLPEGVYIAVIGPSFETPAEIRAFRTLGADLVGMSTVHEVIVARHMGLEVLGISLVTNPAAGVSDDAIDHNDVLAIGQRGVARFTALITAVLPRVAALHRP